MITKLLVGLWIGFYMFFAGPIHFRSFIFGGVAVFCFVAGMIYLLETGFHGGNQLSERRRQVYPLSVGLIGGFAMPILGSETISEAILISATLTALSIGVAKRFAGDHGPSRVKG